MVGQFRFLIVGVVRNALAKALTMEFSNSTTGTMLHHFRKIFPRKPQNPLKLFPVLLLISQKRPYYVRRDS